MMSAEATAPSKPSRRLSPLILAIIATVTSVGLLVLAYFLGVASGLISPLGSDPERAPPTAAEEAHAARYATAALNDTDEVWAGVFITSFARAYTPPEMEFFDDRVTTPCGVQSGPHYCAEDRVIYLDSDFLAELIDRGRQHGELAASYVIAKNVAHHVQMETGIGVQARAVIANAENGQADALRLRLSLHRDCLAGIWSRRARTRIGRLDAEDVDRIMELVRTMEETFVADAPVHRAVRTRRSQHVDWFMRGYQSASLTMCDAVMRGTL
ncbi:MAG: neutral zinc metallopeptidase [Pseudomonadota bacterium]